MRSGGYYRGGGVFEQPPFTHLQDVWPLFHEHCATLFLKLFFKLEYFRPQLCSSVSICKLKWHLVSIQVNVSYFTSYLFHTCGIT